MPIPFALIRESTQFDPKGASIMADLNLIVTPPSIVRKGESQADQTVLRAMVAQIGPEQYVSDGKTYTTAKDAGNACGIYMRALPIALGMKQSEFRRRVWGLDKQGNVIDDRKVKGEWRFAVKTAPGREAQTRKRRSSGS